MSQGVPGTSAAVRLGAQVLPAVSPLLSRHQHLTERSLSQERRPMCVLGFQSCITVSLTSPLLSFLSLLAPAPPCRPPSPAPPTPHVRLRVCGGSGQMTARPWNK